MPEPLRYLQAASAAALAAFLWSATLRWFERRRSPGSPWRGLPWLGVPIGIVVGCAVLGLRPAVPPRNALDRLFVVIVPLTAIVECCGAFGLARRRSLMLLRTCVALLLPGTLLFGSVYLRTSDDGWSWPRTIAIFALLGGGLAGLQWMLTRLAARTSRGAVELSLWMSIQATGLLIMLAGYLKGGAASFALASPLLGFSAASFVARRTTVDPEDHEGHDGESAEATRSAYLGAVLLVSLAVIGRFFGGLTSTAAAFACMAPLSGWVLALAFPSRAITRAGRAVQVALQLAAVALPLLLLLIQGKAAFDRKMGPLPKSQQPTAVRNAMRRSAGFRAAKPPPEREPRARTARGTGSVRSLAIWRALANYQIARHREFSRQFRYSLSLTKTKDARVSSPQENDQDMPWTRIE